VFTTTDRQPALICCDVCNALRLEVVEEAEVDVALAPRFVAAAWAQAALLAHTPFVLSTGTDDTVSVEGVVKVDSDTVIEVEPSWVVPATPGAEVKDPMGVATTCTHAAAAGEPIVTSTPAHAAVFPTMVRRGPTRQREKELWGWSINWLETVESIRDPTFW